MGLDSNLFTLGIQPRAGQPGWVDLFSDGNIDTLAQPAYAAYKAPGEENDQLQLYDPFSDVLYASISTLAPKLKVVEMDSPSAVVEMRASGLISWEWTFIWEEQRYSWRRDIVGMTSERGYTLLVCQKPDPDFPIAVYRPSKRRPTVQVLDYNLARIEPRIEDKKGLEILTVLTLLSFLDAFFPLSLTASPAPIDPRTAAHLRARTASGEDSGLETEMLAMSVGEKGKEGLPPLPPPPPRPVVAQAPVRAATKGKGKGKMEESGISVNEIIIKDEGKVDDYAERCLSLLLDPTLLYITLIARTPRLVSHAVRLAEEVKRRRYKASGEELMQYILPLDDDLPPGPPSARGAYVPPASIKIFLSRLALDELLPLYRPRKPTRKPDIRPPIQLSGAGPVVPPVPQGKLKKGKQEEPKVQESGGFWGSFK